MIVTSNLVGSKKRFAFQEAKESEPYKTMTLVNTSKHI